MITRQQARRLYEERARSSSVEICAQKSGMSRKTASKYLKARKLPEELRSERYWRTRRDPFERVWQEVEQHLLEDEQRQLEAATLFSWLQRRYPGRFQDGQLRTFQRRIKQWRAVHGAGKETYFPQQHRPGELGASDFTDVSGLGVTIQGVAYPHLLYHFVLTYSNWEWATPCMSENFESLSQGLQEALWQLGGAPARHRTDRLSAAVCNLDEEKKFTARYRALVSHYQMVAEKINPRCANENGDVEQRHYRLKRAIEQALILRGSRDFESRQAYGAFLEHLLCRLNKGRVVRLNEELAKLTPLPFSRFESVKRRSVRVTKTSTVLIEENIYSVHSRLIGERVEARLLPEHIELRYGDTVVETLPRLRGKKKCHIQYRHLIDWLLRKPGAFASYVYRDELFPTTNFRIAYDRLCGEIPERGAKEYLQILKLAARESEELVDEAVRILLGDDEPITAERVTRYLEALVQPPAVTDVVVDAVDLSHYDNLLEGVNNGEP